MVSAAALESRKAKPRGRSRRSPASVPNASAPGSRQPGGRAMQTERCRHPARDRSPPAGAALARPARRQRNDAGTRHGSAACPGGASQAPDRGLACPGAAHPGPRAFRHGAPSARRALGRFGAKRKSPARGLQGAGMPCMSRTAYPPTDYTAVLSAMGSLTAEFGMGSGDPPLHGSAHAGHWPCDENLFGCQSRGYPGGCMALVGILFIHIANRENNRDEELGRLVPLA